MKKRIRKAVVFETKTFSASFNPVFFTIPLYVLKYRKHRVYAATTNGNLNNNFSKLKEFRKLLSIKLVIT